jgi:CBS domain-containing protein
MIAREIMTTKVISVRPEMTAGEIAKVLGNHGISGVPVVDATGMLVGIVSEGDLIGRGEAGREARRDWWLTLFAEGETLNPEFLVSLCDRERTAHDLMHRVVITIDEQTELRDVAKLLTDYRIKRVPVVRDGRIVGIVSRADIVRAFAAGDQPARPLAPVGGGLLAEALAGLDGRFFHRQLDRRGDASAVASQPIERDDADLTVDDFRGLIADHDHKQMAERQKHQLAAAEQRQQQISALINRHISGASWRSLVQKAHRAAEKGEKEFMLLRFPSQLCSDGGRAINSTLSEWPQTLRGEVAELYLRWERDLKPRGFRLGARVLDFPSGMPGDVGLFLVWGE